MIASEDLKFLEKMEAGVLPLADFSHLAHMHLAWIYLMQYSLPLAMMKFRETLQRFVAIHGKEDLYNETITFALMMIMNERLQNQINRDTIFTYSWNEFQLAHTDLVNQGKSLLLQFYSEQLLFSAKAKKYFCFPDQLSPFSSSLLYV